MFCAKCGNRIDETMKYCPDCGTETVSSTGVIESSATPFHRRDLTARVNRTLWYKLFYAAVVVVSVGLGIYLKSHAVNTPIDDKNASPILIPSTRTLPIQTDCVSATSSITNAVPTIQKTLLSHTKNAPQPQKVKQDEHSDMEKADDLYLWNAYKVFLDTNYTSLKRKAEWEKFAGKQMICSGRFQDAGDALLGGVYVTVIVDGKWVKLMIDPSQKEKVMALQKGDRITVKGRVSSRGDIFHVITLEQGFIKP